jgi:Na+/H+ antiporter NhaC
MKKAILRANEGEVLPLMNQAELAAIKTMDQADDGKKKSSAWNFIIPIIVLATVTIITAEMLFGVLSAIVVCGLMYFPQRLMNFQEFCAAMLDGFKDMLGVIGIVYAAFVLRVFNDHLGLADYVIGLVKGNISAALLPAVCFIVLSALIFAAGNFWGMAAISFPVVIPMGLAADANMTLMAAAIVCATTFGATACFYGSEVSLTCSSTDVPNVAYAKTSLPIIAVSFVLTIVAFVIAGIVM